MKGRRVVFFAIAFFAVGVILHPVAFAFGVVSSNKASTEDSSDSATSSSFGAGTSMKFHEHKLETNTSLGTKDSSSSSDTESSEETTSTSGSSFSTGSSFQKLSFGSSSASNDAATSSDSPSASSTASTSSKGSAFDNFGALTGPGSISQNMSLGHKDFKFGKTTHQSNSSQS